MRSMNNGISGLKAHQTKMDVIGNNISNVNTTAFKSKNVGFSDILYQNLQNAAGPNATRTSVNANQIGLGTKVGSITTNILSSGATQTTGRALDMRIYGNSFFVVHNGSGEYYTRDGSFNIDANGDLVMSSNGYYVYGWNSADGFTVNRNGALGRINVNSAPKEIFESKTESINFSGNMNGNDATINATDGKDITVTINGKDGNAYALTFNLSNGGDTNKSTYLMTLKGATDAYGDAVVLPSSEGIRLSYDATDGSFVSANGKNDGIVSLDLPGKMGGTVSIDFSNTTSITGSDAVDITGSLPNWVTMDAASKTSGKMSSTYTTSQSYLATDGTTKTVDVDHSASMIDFGAFTEADKASLLDQGFYFTCATCNNHYSVKFTNGSGVNPNGNADYPTISGQHYIYEIGIDDVHSGADLANLVVQATGGQPNNHYTNLIVDPTDSAKVVIYDDRTSDAEPADVQSWNGWTNGDYRLSDTMLGTIGGGVATDGSAMADEATSITANTVEVQESAGTLNGYTFDKSGMVYATYTGGGTRVIGQIAVAQFQNTAGLNNVGENMYEVTQNTGNVFYMDVTEDGGSIINGSLEMSNVSLSDEFANMIITQRGFQLNSRVITTSDTILDTTANLKR